jgi:tRNA(Ile)-lysidine synthase
MDSLRRLLDACSRCLCRYENIIAGRPILAAISGGVDSTVLALTLARLRSEARLPGPLHFCHVDHGVRADSRQNAQHVIDLADHLDVPVHVRRLSLQASATTDRVSEDRMRQARYREIAAVAAATGAATVVTAHHADDNLETVLFRMLRGTGPRGLAGIPEARWLTSDEQKHLLVRPFLRTRRNTIAGLLRRLGYRAFEDSSNQDTRYARNRLRLETIPRLREDLGIGLDVALMTVSSTARAAAEILEAHGRRVLASCTERRTPWSLHLNLRGTGGDDRPFITEALRIAHGNLHQRGETPTGDWLARATDLLDRPDGTRLGGRGSLMVERTRRGLLLLDPGRAGNPPRLGEAGQLFLWDAGKQRFGATEYWLEACEHPQPPLVPPPTEAGPLRALIDPRNAPLPWRMRIRRPGDRFQPLGSEHEMQLRGFLQRRHVPRFERDRLPVLVDAQDRILWVPGAEISEHCKVRLNTRRTIEIRCETR